MSSPIGSALNPRYPYFTKLEDTSPSVRYVGEVNPTNSSDTSLPVWRIRRETTNNSGVTTVEYANGGHFSAKWDDRSTYFGAAPSGPGLTFGLEPQTYDQVTFTYNGAGYVDTAAYRYNTSVVRLLSFTYDGSNRLIDISKTDY